MTDPFVDRVAALAGRTVRALNDVADVLERDGEVAQAASLRTMATAHSKVAADALTETQPIDLDRRPPGRQLRDLAEEARQVAGHMVEGHYEGDRLVKEAAILLDQAARASDPD